MRAFWWVNMRRHAVAGVDQLTSSLTISDRFILSSDRPMAPMTRGARAQLGSGLGFDPRVADMMPERDRDTSCEVSSVAFCRFIEAAWSFAEAVASSVADLTLHGALSIELLQRLRHCSRKSAPHCGGAKCGAFSAARSQITLNHHGDVPAYAINMRPLRGDRHGMFAADRL